MKRIAIIEDEQDIRNLLKIHVERNGYRALLFANGNNFLEYQKKNHIDLILLDIMLPGQNGLEILKYLQQHEKHQHIPIIMLSAISTEVDIILGLELGADDYITKPFSPRELMARIKAFLRRVNKEKKQYVLKIGDVVLYPDSMEVLNNGVRIDLTTSEFRILKTLVKRKNHVLSRSQLLESIGDDKRFVIDRTIDVHILNIRRKLGGSGKFLLTIRGIGYKIVEK